MGSQPRAALATRGTRGKPYDPAAVYDPREKPQQRPRKSPEKPTPPPARSSRFPDEDHTYHPLRRVQVAKLKHNTLPPPTPSPRETSTRKRHRLANLTDSALWGFPVRYSPSEELSEQWTHAKVDESMESVSKSQQEEEAAAAEREEQQAQRRAELSRQDYTLYLYLASRYGALDAILYCCTPFPGRLYALLIDQCVRKLQKWRQERLLALRKYWIVTLAREVVLSGSHHGIGLVLRAREHQRRAGVFLKQLRWRFAVSAFCSWFEYTQKQIEVRWRFQFAMQEDVRARFERWHQRVADVKAFKKQLKQVARRKQMQSALGQWQEWKERQQKLRTYLQTQWTKLQRNCMEQWRLYAARAKAQRLAVVRLQTQWRMYRARRHFKHIQISVTRITATVRGFLARRSVMKLRHRLEVVQVLEQMTRVLEWQNLAEQCHVERSAAVERELVRATREAQYIAQVEQDAAAFVTSELDKVRKNDMHHKLQQKIREFQDGEGDRTDSSTRGGRTQEAFAQQALELLIQEMKAAARDEARHQLLDEVECNGGFADAGSSFVCCVCTATTIEVQHHSVAWAAAYFPEPQRPCPHNSSLNKLDATTPDQLSQAYNHIVSELQTHDAHTCDQLLHDAIPMPILWARSRQISQ